MSEPTRIRVVTPDEGEATREAASLRTHLLDAAATGVDIAIEKEDVRTQDTGATLVLALGTPAVVAIAQAIGDWLRKRRIGSSLELQINGNVVRASGEIADDPNRLAKIIAALKQ